MQDSADKLQQAVAKRVLLVDGDSQLLFSLTGFLSRKGYHVVSAESGARALEAVIDSSPDVIVSDILMEEMDGFELQQRVNSLTGSSIPLIFLTAKDDMPSRLRGLRSGADDYVIKPFEPEELEARIAAVLLRVEQTRREERRDLEALRDRILSEVSRELQAPVSSIVTHLNLLLSQRFGDDRGRMLRHLRSALEDANALRELIDDLAWASVDSPSQLAVKREPIRVAPIVRGAAANAARLAGEKGIDIKITCGGLLSAMIDGRAMERALSGILEAAVQVSPPQSQVRITATRAQEGGVEFTVTDSGSISSSTVDALGGAPSTSGALDFARRVVKGHGGRFSVNTQERGQQDILIWLPGRVAKRVGKRP